MNLSPKLNWWIQQQAMIYDLAILTIYGMYKAIGKHTHLHSIILDKYIPRTHAECSSEQYSYFHQIKYNF